MNPLMLDLTFVFVRLHQLQGSSVLTHRTALRRFIHTGKMAKSKFEYVKQFETEDRLMPNCWAVVRIDGKAFHR